MNPQELMKPRYKVIADWPGVAGKISIGDIIISDGATNGFWVAGQPFMEDKLKDYPHLFKPLQWWEDRAAEDMPQYVKSLELPSHCVKVEKHYISFFEGIRLPNSYWEAPYSEYQPSTESEYLQEKEQHKFSYQQGRIDFSCELDNGNEDEDCKSFKNFKEYYNQTYNS